MMTMTVFTSLSTSISEVANESFDEDHLLAKFVYGDPMEVTKEDVLAYLKYDDLDRLEQQLREEDTVLYYRDGALTMPIEQEVLSLTRRNRLYLIRSSVNDRIIIPMKIPASESHYIKSSRYSMDFR